MIIDNTMITNHCISFNGASPNNPYKSCAMITAPAKIPKAIAGNNLFFVIPFNKLAPSTRTQNPFITAIKHNKTKRAVSCSASPWNMVAHGNIKIM